MWAELVPPIFTVTDWNTKKKFYTISVATYTLKTIGAMTSSRKTLVK